MNHRGGGDSCFKTLLVLTTMLALAGAGQATSACDGVDNCFGVYFDEGVWEQTCLEPPVNQMFHMYFVLQNRTIESHGGIEFGWRYAPQPSSLPLVVGAAWFGPGPCFPPIYNVMYGVSVPMPVEGPIVILDVTLLIFAPISAHVQLGPSTPDSLDDHAAINDFYNPATIIPLSFGTPVGDDGWTLEGSAYLGDCTVAVEPAVWGDVKSLFR